jgi:acetolactate synthase-1/2/3 large subunit
MKANELLIKFLESEGVAYIFGVPGAPLMPIFHAMYDSRAGIKPIISKHEEGGAFMADGFARVSGKIGVCCGTSGPGTTNLITGVVNSYKECVPVLVLTAQVPTTNFGKGAIQECSGEDRSFPSAELLRSFTKHSAMLLSHENLGFTIRRSLRTALHPPMGPVHLNLPPDIMRREVKESDTSLEMYKVEASYFDRNMVKEAAKALLKSKRPVFLLGLGTILSGAAEEALKIAELLGIPVATTPKAKGAFPENHPLALGVFGLAGNPSAFSYILPAGKSDLLFSVGMSFEEWGTNGWDPHLKGEKILIQLDIDPTQIGKNYPVNIGLIGNAKTILQELWFELHREIKKSDYTPSRTQKQILHHKELNPFYNESGKMSDTSVPIKPQRLIADIRKAVPNNGIFFVDCGNNTLWAVHYLQIYEPRSFIVSLGFGPMGYAIAAAIGGKLAAPERPVVCICGDGGFFMHGMEIATAVNYDIPVIWIVMNDSRLNMIYQGESLQNKPGLENYEFKPVNIAQIAQGFGARGIRIESPEEIIPEIQEALAANKPTVLDVIIDKDELSPIKERVRAIQRFMKS